MPEEYESNLPHSRITLMMSMIIHLIGFFLNFVLAAGVVVISVWVVRQFVPFSIFEASVVSIGVWGLVLLGAIYSKMSSVETAVAQDEWEEDYDFYNPEDYEETLDSQETINPPTNSTRGNVIHLEQKIFSEKQDKK